MKSFCKVCLLVGSVFFFHGESWAKADPAEAFLESVSTEKWALSETKKAEAGEKLAIMTGDKLKITVHGEPELSSVYSVDEAGDISFPLLGRINTTGLKIDELQADLQGRLAKDYLVDPQVEVGYEESLQSSISVLGQVTHPGNYLYRPKLTLLKMISEAGGFNQAAAHSVVKIVRTADNGIPKAIQVNTDDILNGIAPEPELMPGDLIFVPRISSKSEEKDDYVNSVSIMGKVAAPGNYRVAEGITLVKILSQAGGFSKGANAGTISIRRMSKGASIPDVFQVNLKAILEGGEPDVEVLSGDTIFVPGYSVSGEVEIDLNNVVSLLGQVQKPGNYDAASGMTLIKLVSLAGGFSRTADSTRVHVTRTDGQNSQTRSVVNVNAAAIISGKREDYKLQVGDIVYVPESIF